MEAEIISYDQLIPAPVDSVWRAWTDPRQVQTWFAKRANVSAKVGGPYELFWDLAHPEGTSTMGCRVTEATYPERLAFTWRGPAPFAGSTPAAV